MVTESPYYPTFACNGLSSQSHLDQPRYKTWQHVRKPDTEGKGDSPWVPCRKEGHANADCQRSTPLEHNQGWRAVCAERCTYGSGRGLRHDVVSVIVVLGVMPRHNPLSHQRYP